MTWDVVSQNIPLFVKGTLTTAKLGALIVLLSVALAIPLAVIRDSHVAALRISAAVFSWVTRAVPSLALLFLIYYGLPSFGLSLDPFPAAVIGLTITATGYNMEYIRAGLRAVPQTQYETCRALGMPLHTSIRRVILPQAMRVIVPPLTSNLTLVLKGTSLANLVAVTELTGAGMGLISITYRPIEILTVIALIYLMLNALLVGLQRLVEHHYRLRSQ